MDKGIMRITRSSTRKEHNVNDSKMHSSCSSAEATVQHPIQGRPLSRRRTKSKGWAYLDRETGEVFDEAPAAWYNEDDGMVASIL